MRLSCLQVVASLLLASFVAAKAVFWFGLIPIGAELSNPIASHFCACSGKQVCVCVSDNCCDLASTGDPSQNGWPTKIQARNLCGSLSLGGGLSFGEMTAISTYPDVCCLLPWDSRLVPLVVVNLPVSRTDGPDSPPPKA